MSFKNEFEECIENLRAIEVSCQIAKDMDELLPSFFKNNFARLKKINKELKRLQRTQSGFLFRRKFSKKHVENA